MEADELAADNERLRAENARLAAEVERLTVREMTNQGVCEILNGARYEGRGDWGFDDERFFNTDTDGPLEFDENDIAHLGTEMTLYEGHAVAEKLLRDAAPKRGEGRGE